MARRYITTGRYSAWRDGQRLGPWESGTEVELDDCFADWVGRDSPGILVPVDQQSEPAHQVPDVARQARPARDRQHKGGRTR